MSNQHTSPKGYTAVHYFFWVIAGSEIPILKKCPADYNRHASIGLTIFMTCLFAGFAGGLAGYSIGDQDIRVGVVFGLIWAMLVFSIDRSMVVSIKKSPDKSISPVWFVIPRAGLAALIAFVISIPLETKIFEEEIEIQMAKDKVREKGKYLSDFQNSEQIDAKGERISDQDDKLAELDSLLNTPCPTAKCKSLRASISVD
ncbi:MAG: DUF4407 domain-containing protein, partial [Bacteroidota bacterium]